MSNPTAPEQNESQAATRTNEPIPMTGGVYTPLDPLAQEIPVDGNSAAGPDGSQSSASKTAENTPGHHSADRAIEYDDQTATAGR